MENQSIKYSKIIPSIIAKALKIPEQFTFYPAILNLLRDNVTSNGELQIKTRPIIQLSLNDEIIRMWSGPSKAIHTLGYGRNLIESVLYGKCKTTQGYKWRLITIEELGKPNMV